MDIKNLSFWKLSAIKIKSETELIGLLEDINNINLDENIYLPSKLKYLISVSIAIINNALKDPNLKKAILNFIDQTEKIRQALFFVTLNSIYELFYPKNVYIFIEYTTKLISKFTSIKIEHGLYVSGIEEAITSYLNIVFSSEKKFEYLEKFFDFIRENYFQFHKANLTILKCILDNYDTIENKVVNEPSSKEKEIFGIAYDIIVNEKETLAEKLKNHRNFLPFLVHVVGEDISSSYHFRSIDLLRTLENKFNAFLEVLKEKVNCSNKILFDLYKDNFLGNFLLFLAEVLPKVDINPRKSDFLCKLVPYIPEDKFEPIYRKLVGSTYSAILLNHPIVEKNETLKKELLKIYLSSPCEERKLEHPRLKISAQMVEELSDTQLVKLLLRSYKTEFNRKGNHPIRFAYDQDAIEVVERRIFTLLLEGKISQEIVSCFMDAHKVLDKI